MFFIPSRRQIEYNGGYVNNWSTKEFVSYVKYKNPTIKIERDHSGPSQGSVIDDGFKSLSEDCKYMDIIHIDPFKFCKKLDDCIKWTIEMINFCNNINPNLEYEIATEEAIQPFSIDELEYMIIQLKESLKSDVLNKIKYLVIQCGTKLSTGENIGSFDEEKLKDMLQLAKKYNLIAKEHNGDWINNDIIKRKTEIGLTCINIAPEMGEIESKIILKNIKNNKDDYEKVYNLCIESEKWKKWVKDDFDYLNEKDKIILITGHYIFSNPEFKKLKEKYKNIDNEIKTAITNRLLELYNLI
jgi:fructose/tagatose bisphosphate aldolase